MVFLALSGWDALGSLKGQTLLADVAAECPIAHHLRFFGRKLTALLNGEVADAPTAIDDPPACESDDGAGWAGIDALVTRAAATFGRRVGLKIKGRQKKSKHEPATAF